MLDNLKWDGNEATIIDWKIPGMVDPFENITETLDELIGEFDPYYYSKVFSERRRNADQVVEVVPCSSFKPSEKLKMDEQKLKKRITEQIPNKEEVSSGIISLKKVKFDVEKFAADECDDAVERSKARARLAIKLGARPAKNDYINYRQLKEEMKTIKNSKEDFDKLAPLLALKKLSLKNQKKKKKAR